MCVWRYWCVCKHIIVHTFQQTHTNTHTHTHSMHTADGIPQVVMAAGSEESLSTATADSASLEVGGVGGVASSDPFSEDPLQPPSWESHSSGDRDTLEEVGRPYTSDVGWAMHLCACVQLAYEDLQGL